MALSEIYFIAFGLEEEDIMCSPAGAAAGVGGIFGGFNAREEAINQNKANRFNAWVKDQEARNAEMQATQAETVGRIEENKFRQQAETFKGEQRASFGASGAVVDEGSALDTLLDTAEFAELDALTIRRNAEIDAWNFREQARVSRETGKRYASQMQDPDKAFLYGGLAGATGGFASAGGFSAIGKETGSTGRSGSKGIRTKSTGSSSFGNGGYGGSSYA